MRVLALSGLVLKEGRGARPRAVLVFKHVRLVFKPVHVAYEISYLRDSTRVSSVCLVHLWGIRTFKALAT